MKLSFCVCTTPGREECLRRVVAQIPQCTIYCDHDKTGGSWASYARVLEDAGSRGEDWAISLDDDAILCRDFPRQAAKVLSARPEDPFVGFYLSHKPSTRRAVAAGASWVSTVRVVHGIGWAIRPDAAREALAYARDHVHADYYSGDQRLLAWLCESGQRNMICIPNLIDHDTTIDSCITGRPARPGSRSASYVHDLSGIDYPPRVYRDTASRQYIFRKLAARGMFVHVPRDRSSDMLRDARKKTMAGLVRTANAFIRAYDPAYRDRDA